jgi:hypothetical protein
MMQATWAHEFYRERRARLKVPSGAPRTTRDSSGVMDSRAAVAGIGSPDAQVCFRQSQDTTCRNASSGVAFCLYERDIDLPKRSTGGRMSPCGNNGTSYCPEKRFWARSCLKEMSRSPFDPGHNRASTLNLLMCIHTATPVTQKPDIAIRQRLTCNTQ